MKQKLIFLILSLSSLLFISAEQPIKQFVSFSFDGKPYIINSGGKFEIRPMDGNVWLNIQQVSEDTITFKKPMLDFGVALYYPKQYTDEEIIGLVKDTIFVPKEYWIDGHVLTDEIERTAFPRPIPVYFFDGKTDFMSAGTRSRGYMKFSSIKKISEKRFLCDGTFELEYLMGGTSRYFKYGSFRMILNLRQ